MKVIEYGHIKPLYAFCSGCGSILEFTARESKMSNLHISKGPQDNGKDYFIVCPVCGRVIFDKDYKATLEEC